MPRPRRFDTADVDTLLRSQHNVATHGQLAALGVPRSTTIRWASADHGPWQRMLPGVILGHRGTPTRQERRRAALAYGGQDSVLTGLHALDLHGVLRDRLDPGASILVAIPHCHQVVSKDFVVVERTRRNPRAQHREGFPVAACARAAVDAARWTADKDVVREIFGALLQQSRVTVTELHREILAAPRQRTRNSRSVVVEVAAGVRSAAEAPARALVEEICRELRIESPLYNEDVVVDGLVVGSGDMWWPRLKVAGEVDSFRWHQTPEAMRRTQEKQRRYAMAGIVLLSIAPIDLLQRREHVRMQIRETLARASAQAV